MSTEVNECARPGARASGRSMRPLLTSTLFFRRSHRGVRLLAAFVWLLFIVFPLLNAIAKHGSPVSHAFVIGGAAVFVAVYVTLVLTWRREGRNRLPLVLFVLLLAVAIALTLWQASAWGFLFTYCAACAAIAVPATAGFYAVALCSVLAAGTASVAGASGGTVLGFVASSAGIGLLMLVMSDLRLRNEELNQARAELARMAVAQERERFARDLHDLLGHTLSVIALKAELAGRMLDERPEQAAQEVAELEQVARSALGEVREAVSGYHQPTLDGELAGARMALAAAGIEVDVDQIRVALDPAVEAVLAWTVREGATNVIRHSGARHCTVRMTASLTDAAVEVIDDGVGDAVGAGESGDGERVGGGGRLRGGGRLGGRGRSGEADRPGGRGRSGDADRPGGRGRPGDADRPGGGRLGGGGLPAPTNAGTITRTPGHGLAGLAERARLVNGTLDAGTLAGGGYRLAVTVPVVRA